MGKDGKKTRNVAVAIPFIVPSPTSDGRDASLPQIVPEPLFLVVSSRRHKGRFVFPKGGVETGESPSQAASREAWEEGGLKGEVIACIASDVLSPRYLENTEIPKASYTIHLVLVTSLDSVWPESHERARKWLTRTEAQEQTAWREEISLCFDLIPKDLAGLMLPSEL